MRRSYTKKRRPQYLVTALKLKRSMETLDKMLKVGFIGQDEFNISKLRLIEGLSKIQTVETPSDFVIGLKSLVDRNILHKKEISEIHTILSNLN